MSVLRKPHPLGNEYHSIADGDEGYPVMYRIIIQEGKDRPKNANGKVGVPLKVQGENPNTGRKYAKTISKRVDFEQNTHEPWAELVQKIVHGLIEATKPGGSVVLQIVLIEIVYHLQHIMKPIQK